MSACVCVCSTLNSELKKEKMCICKLDTLNVRYPIWLNKIDCCCRFWRGRPCCRTAVPISSQLTVLWVSLLKAGRLAHYRIARPQTAQVRMWGKLSNWSALSRLKTTRMISSSWWDGKVLLGLLLLSRWHTDATTVVVAAAAAIWRRQFGRQQANGGRGRHCCTVACGDWAAATAQCWIGNCGTGAI